MPIEEMVGESGLKRRRESHDSEGTRTDETIKAIEDLNVPFRHFKTTEVGYIRKEIFS